MRAVLANVMSIRFWRVEAVWRFGVAIDFDSAAFAHPDFSSGIGPSVHVGAKRPVPFPRRRGEP